MDLWEFKASLIYRASSRTGSEATEKPSRKREKERKAALIHDTQSTRRDTIPCTEDGRSVDNVDQRHAMQLLC